MRITPVAPELPPSTGEQTVVSSLMAVVSALWDKRERSPPCAIKTRASDDVDGERRLGGKGAALACDTRNKAPPA